LLLTHQKPLEINSQQGKSLPTAYILQTLVSQVVTKSQH
jgi:hypothetical protein